MQKKFRFLKFCFMTGAIADGFALLPMLFPSIRESVFGTSGPAFGPGYQYAMAIAAALMAGWTLLLIWGYKKPVERQGILLLTAIPVIPGLISANIYSVVAGIIPINKMIPIWGLEVALMILFIYGFIQGKPLRHNNTG